MSNQSEIDRLESEVRESSIEVCRLESRLADVPRQMDKLQHELNLAKNRKEQSLTRLRKLKPIVLPPVPSSDEMLALARRQCPDRDPEVVKRLAMQMHAAAVTGSNSGESYYARGGEPDMTGDVREVGDTKYDIPPPPPSEGLPADYPPPPPIPTRAKITYG
jgi:hypothetical protein